MSIEDIPSNLEKAFSQLGFAEPNVPALRAYCDVSLRTLYKHYPSKTSMIMTALEHRHQRYLSQLQPPADLSSADAVAHIFAKLFQWMTHDAPQGCLFTSAIASYPDDATIKALAVRHKQDLRDLFCCHSPDADRAMSLFLLHEGVSTAWPLMGEALIKPTQSTIQTLLKQ